MDDLVARDDDDRQDEVMLREHGVDPDELSDSEREELTDDYRSELLDSDDDQLSDVVPPEEDDGND